MSDDQQGLFTELEQLGVQRFSVLDCFGDGSLAEKVMSLMLDGVPDTLGQHMAKELAACRQRLVNWETEGVRVVVFGGGTGLSNIIGGDSRLRTWWQKPFTGLKELFPRLHSVVCITDDGGSTGELLKDLPLVALGDIRHVLLASVRWQLLRARYQLDRRRALRTMKALHGLFNYRFISRPSSGEELLQDTGVSRNDLPRPLLEYLCHLVGLLFEDPRVTMALDRPQCLGNLILAAAIYRQLDPALDATGLLASPEVVRTATIRGLAEMASNLGVARNAVLPCTTSAAQLQVQYANGVLATGEDKSSRADRKIPVDQVYVEFLRKPYLQPEVVRLVDEADIILLAPGSLYSSIIPIFQVPGLADAVRANTRALKLLIANIWVQKGETDFSRDEPDRKFYVSDLILAYNRSIPGGVKGLFSHVLTLKLRDIPGSVLQRYAIEQKEPIYLDPGRVAELGFSTVQARIFSRDKLEERRVIQHDPDALAQAVKAMWALYSCGQLVDQTNQGEALPAPEPIQVRQNTGRTIPCQRYEDIRLQMHHLVTDTLISPANGVARMGERSRLWILDRLVEITWLHPDILNEHLQFFQGVTIVDKASWSRCQAWDNVYSFFDPKDGRIKIRQDLTTDLNRLEMAFLVGLGQSLLGNYALAKEMEDLRDRRGEVVGRLFRLTIRERPQLKSYFSPQELDSYLRLLRMQPSLSQDRTYTRTINAGEGFTPPGLFFGLFFAWYLDNRFAPNIEYKMSIMHNNISDLIPEQVRIVDRRRSLIGFFRQRVFRQDP
jgi:uncharacterized cofD-like protein